MARQDLSFDVFALDKASRTFSQIADRVDKLSDELKELDRQRASPEIEVDTQRATAQAQRAARAFASAAEDEGSRHKRSFFASIFTPNRGIVQALRTGIPAALGSPIGAAAITLGGTFAASFAAAVVSSGAIAGVGAAFTGLAAVALKENERVVTSFENLAATAQAALTEAAQPLVPVFDDALSRVRGMFDQHIADPLGDIFAGLGPSIVPAAESAVETVGGVLDSLSTPEFLSSMHTILGEIADEAPRLGDAVGDALTTIAGDGEEVAESFESIVSITSGLIDFAADATAGFTRLFNVMSSIGDIDLGAVSRLLSTGAQPRPEEAAGAADLVSGFQDLDLRTFATGLGHARDANATTAGMFTALGPIVDPVIDAMSRGSGQAEVFAAEIQGLASRAEQAAQEGLAEMQRRQEQLTDAIDGTTNQISHEEDQLQRLKDTMFAASERVLGLRDSTRTYEEAIDAARESLEENGETLDVNTEKGRANQEAIDDIAASALGHIEMMIRQGEETDKVSQFTEQAREDFINAAEAAGMEEEKASDLADQLGLVPSEVETKIEAIDEMSDTINSLKRQLRELQRQAGVVPIGTTNPGAFFGSALVPPDEFHSGGKVGSGVPRAHSGMRLASDERVIIGQTGERILSREQNRAFEAGARMAGAGGGGSATINVENFHAAPNMDVGEVAERFWFLTKARG